VICDLACFSYLAPARVLTVDRYPAPDFGAVIRQVTPSFAADGPLAAVMVAAMGFNCALVSNAIGRATGARDVVSRLDRLGVKHSANEEMDLEPFVEVIEDLDSHRVWLTYLDDLEQQLGAIALSPMADCRLAYVDCYEAIRSPALRAIEYTSARSIPTIVNMGGSSINSADATRLRDCHPSILQNSCPESEFTTALAILDELSAVIGARIVVVTLGSEGAIYTDRNRTVWLKSHDIEARRLHGAGAAFSAGMAVGLLEDLEIDRLMQLAMARAALHCASTKDLELPRSAVDARMRELGQASEKSLGSK
jgi:sugar/nucleoside kinase (ribokinase family)